MRRSPSLVTSALRSVTDAKLGAKVYVDDVLLDAATHIVPICECRGVIQKLCRAQFFLSVKNELHPKKLVL